MQNGSDTGPMAGWAVVQSNGLTLIGRVRAKSALQAMGAVAGPVILAPVFELKPQMAMGQQGMQLAHVALPVWLLGIHEWEVRDSDHLEPCESFTLEQRKRLHASCQGASELQEQMKNEGARVVLAPANALAGLPGGKKP